MPASLHIASFSAANAARVVAQTRALHRTLRNTPGVAAGRLFATANYSAITSGYPTLHRYALFCAFESHKALADYESSRAAEQFEGRANELWRLTLDPVKVVNGSWRGWHPKIEDAAPLADDEPMAVMTYGVVRPRYLPKFAFHNRKVIARSMDQEGQLVRLALFDRPLSVCTFSVWKGKDDALRFAYGSQSLHRAVIRPWRDTPWGVDNFFVRFRIRDSTGTYNGRDPIAFTP